MKMDDQKLNSDIKVDLHIHSKSSEYKDGDLVQEGTIENLPLLLNKIDEKGINLFAFSDHNRFDSALYLGAKKLLSNDNYTNIKGILPSVEFDVQIDEGKPSCHVLTIFDARDQEIEKIAEGIQPNQLINKEDFYKLNDFESILKKIGLSVLLIACQRKSLSNPNGGKNCISDSSDDIEEFLKIGYIDALEYQSPKVEGILNANLSSFPENIKPGLVAGSDCHDWSVYPYHDKREAAKGKEKSFFFTIRALPTFKGLLMAFSSPNTRFKRSMNQNDYLHEFSINGNTVPLSPGFNAIIGENGSGKSTLLEGLAFEKPTKPYVSKLLKANKFACSNPKKEDIKYVGQSQLIENANSSSGSIFGSEVSFPSVDNKEFSDSVNSFVSQIEKIIDNNISYRSAINKLDSKCFEFDISKENFKAYYVHISKNDSFTDTPNPHTDRLKQLNGILQSLKSEYELNYYSTEQRTHLRRAFNDISSVRSDVMEKYKECEALERIKNLIVANITTYEDSIKQLASTKETENSQYTKDKTSFIDTIMAPFRINRNHRNLASHSFVTDKGKVSFSKNGFEFITTSDYFQRQDIGQELIKYLFNSDYQSLSEIDKIDTLEKANNAVKRSEDNYKQKLHSGTKQFIDNLCKYTTTIMEVSSQNNIGNTLGEKSVVYYKFITQGENRRNIYFIDQPEDNISTNRILNGLFQSFERLRDKSQIIFVTHNPLLVVNLDVDNVIFLKKENNNIKVSSGCLEYGNILETVSNNMDGGIDAIRKRVKVYEHQ